MPNGQGKKKHLEGPFQGKTEEGTFKDGKLTDGIVHMVKDNGKDATKYFSKGKSVKQDEYEKAQAKKNKEKDKGKDKGKDKDKEKSKDNDKDNEKEKEKSKKKDKGKKDKN